MGRILMRYSTVALFVAMGAVTACLSVTAHAERRVALVIGNGAYKSVPKLPNPPNDAKDVSDTLKRIGFETITAIDADKAGMEEAEIRFTRCARCGYSYVLLQRSCASVQQHQFFDPR